MADPVTFQSTITGTTGSFTGTVRAKHFVADAGNPSDDTGFSFTEELTSGLFGNGGSQLVEMWANNQQIQRWDGVVGKTQFWVPAVEIYDGYGDFNNLNVSFTATQATYNIPIKGTTATFTNVLATHRNTTDDENTQPTAVFGDLEIYSEYATVGEISRVYLRNTATYGTVVLQNTPVNEESDNLSVDWNGFAASRFSTSTNSIDYAIVSNGVDNFTVRFANSQSG
jgi:hypothetical protein